MYIYTYIYSIYVYMTHSGRVGGYTEEREREREQIKASYEITGIGQGEMRGIADEDLQAADNQYKASRSPATAQTDSSEQNITRMFIKTAMDGCVYVYERERDDVVFIRVVGV